MSRGLVVIDEAHHFRNPTTWRYRNVAPWLVGRPVLLMTATPVVNRLDDLRHQLLLAIRDDALAPDGVLSLKALLGRGRGSPALGRLVIESPCPEGLRPERRNAAAAPAAAECEAADWALASIERLGLSRVPGTEALVRTVLRHAAASSPAALAAALRRYRHLLLHARDAAGAGRVLERAAIRRFTGEVNGQLVWWELMPEGGDPNDLRLDDLERIDDVIAQATGAEAQADGKVERLRSLLADGRTTLVFTSRRETVRYLRDRLGPPPLAWCTGARAGLGHCPMPRAAVLGWFRAQREGAVRPAARHLLVTDVAAEGLDLQRAARVVHYDLPWTPMRMEQREGRAVRPGSIHREVEVVAFRPPPAIDRALRITRALAAKAGLPAAAGLGDAGRGLWRWRSELADVFAQGEAALGTAVVPRGPVGVLAGFELFGREGGQERRLASALIWIEPGGVWTEEERIVAARLADAASSRSAEPDPDGCATRWHWSPSPYGPGSRKPVGAGGPSPPRIRLPAWFRSGSINWFGKPPGVGISRRLGSLERALAFVGRGHTAGESAVLERLARMPDGAVRPAGAPPSAGRPTPVDAIEARLGGMLLFVPD